MNEACERLLALAKARGCYALTVQVLADGRVNILGLNAEGMARLHVRADLLPGGADPTPEQALVSLERATKELASHG